MVNAKSFTELLTLVANYDRTEVHDIEVLKPNVHAELMREIGAPWNWLNQFVSLYLPQSKSFNFRECHHTDAVDQHIIRIEPHECAIGDCKGIGASVQPTKIESLLAYLHSNMADGLTDPTQFESSECPPLN